MICSCRALLPDILVDIINNSKDSNYKYILSYVDMITIHKFDTAGGEYFFMFHILTTYYLSTKYTQSFLKLC